MFFKLMAEKFKSILNNFKDTENRFDYIKLILLGAAFFFIIGTYSVIRPLKTSIFLGLVGKEYQPLTKIITVIVLIPCMLIYSRLVDKLRRYQVVYTFLLFYVVGIIMAALILTHPTIGLSNTDTSPNRIFGWIFYLLIDLYSPLAVSTFWAFANSISTPEYAKKNYGNIVAFSRISGIITPLLSLSLLNNASIHISTSIPILLITSAIFLSFALLCIYLLIKKVPGYKLHGYEAVYQAEKQRDKPKVGILEGLKLMLTEPYVFGIFGLVYIYEIISVILDYQMQVQMSIETNNAILGMSSFMLKYTSCFQAIGFFFAFFGTSALLKRIGVKSSLFIMPIATILMMVGLLFYQNLAILFVVMALLRALHYGFNAPVREILYIPTTKGVKFKSKAWIESFGRSLSKTSGSMYSFVVQFKGPMVLAKINSALSISLSFIWIFLTLFVGRKYSKTIKNNEIIGQEK